jgi:hypothetical protein
MSIIKRKVTPRDDAMHPNPSPGWWEWWYFDADFDNGYIIAGTFHFGSPRPPANRDVRFIEIAIYDPEGNCKLIRKRYPKEQCRASEETCDVVIGPNTFKGEIPQYKLCFSEGDQGFDLTYESMVEGCIPLEELEPQLSPYLGWVVAQPRARVTGTLTVDGKTVNVSGEGYHDHNWANAPMTAAISDNTFWGRTFIGDYALCWSAGPGLRKLGYVPSGRIVAAKKDKITAISGKGTAIGSNLTAEGLPEELGIQYPRDILLQWDDPGVVEGKIKFKVTKMVTFFDLHSRFKPFQRWLARRYIGKPAYFRYFMTYDANIKVRGQKVVGKGKTWCEHHKFV